MPILSMTTKEVVGTWFIGQATRGNDPPLVGSQTVVRPQGMLGTTPEVDHSGNGSSMEAKVDQCMMSIRMLAEMMIKDRAQDRRMIEDWVSNHSRGHAEVVQQIESILSKQGLATSHREHGGDTLEKKLLQQFQSQQLWQADQFVKLRSHFTYSLLEIERAVGIRADVGPEERPPVEPALRSLPRPGVKAANKERPRQLPIATPPSKPEAQAGEARYVVDAAAATPVATPAFTPDTTGGDVQKAPTLSSSASMEAAEMCGIDWERKKLTKYLRRMHNISGKGTLAEHVVRSGHLDRAQLSSWTSKPSGPVTRFADGAYFAIYTAVAIISNSFWIGFQTNFAMGRLVDHRMSDIPRWHRTVNRVYAIVFAIELVVRLAAYRLHFFCSQDWAWNLYDAVVVLSAILEEVMESVNLNVMRALRIFRVVRVVRIVRMLRFFMRFRHIVCTVLSCATMLFWTCLFLAFLIYLFAVIFMQGIITMSPEDDVKLIADLEKMYGGVDKAMYTLFQSLTNGRPWVEFMDPLARISWIFIPLFCGYLILILFGVLNVLTGVFVGETRELQERDRDLAVHNEMAAAEAFCAELKYLLGDHGMVKDDQISVDVFDSVSCEDVEMFLQSHGLDSMDAHELFLLLDVEDTGIMPISDFVYGCQRLKSPAKGMDLVLMYEQVVGMKDKLAENRDTMRRCVREIQVTVSQMTKEMHSVTEEVAEVTYTTGKMMDRIESTEARELIPGMHATDVSFM